MWAVNPNVNKSGITDLVTDCRTQCFLFFRLPGKVQGSKQEARLQVLVLPRGRVYLIDCMYVGKYVVCK